MLRERRKEISVVRVKDDKTLGRSDEEKMQRYQCAFFCVLAAQFICGADNARVNMHAPASIPACGLNGNYHTPKRKHIKAGCICDSGWMGPSCSVLNLALMQPLKQQHGQQLSQQQVPGVDLPNQPTWGGGVQYSKMANGISWWARVL